MEFRTMSTMNAVPGRSAYAGEVDTIRALARKAKSPETCTQLLLIAALYEKLGLRRQDAARRTLNDVASGASPPS